MSMPSAKVADGQLCKIVQEVNCEKSEEDKKKDIELFKKLNERRQALEDKLLNKLEELKSTCVREGELTGNLPLEIYKTLMPGEVEPKVKRRVGTTFKLSQSMLQHTSDDHTGQLEADIELHRKIVAAAERLAKDKSANKSVRKKRRKDWQAASQKLKGLEKGLYDLRVSSSKPDVSMNNFENFLISSNCGSGFSLNNLKGWSNGLSNYYNRNATKSCPTTPRGSVPDLSENGIKRPGPKLSVMKSNTLIKGKVDDFVKHTSTKSLLNTRCSEPEATLSNTLPGSELPPTIPNKRLFGSSLSVSSTHHAVKQSQEYLDESHFCDSPLYANVGYTSSAPYKSAYRQSNFPTIQDSKRANLSNNCLNKFTASTSTCFSVEKSSNENCTNKALHPFLRQVTESTVSLHPQTQHHLQQQRCSSSSAGSISIGSIASTTSSSGYHSSTLQINPLGSITTNPLDYRLSDRRTASFGPSRFSTTSLDRRAVKGPIFDVDEESEMLYHNPMITTFPVNDYCRPLQASDFSKYRSNSAVRPFDPFLPSASSTLKKSSISASGLPPLRSSGYGYNYHHSNNFPVLHADPRIEKLLASIHSRAATVANGSNNTIDYSEQPTAESDVPLLIDILPERRSGKGGTQEATMV